MDDVQDFVQSAEHGAEGQDAAAPTPLYGNTIGWTAKLCGYGVARASALAMKNPAEDSPDRKVTESAEEVTDEPKVDKTTTTTTKTTWKFFYEGMIYTAGVAAAHYFVYPDRVGSTVFISFALLSVLGIRIKRTTKNNARTTVVYTHPKKTSVTDID